MKKLYMVGGAMGVGKTATCQRLKDKLDRAVMLDGDWCWEANPFIVTEETKAMVLDNICHLLNNFLHCAAYENIIFCWVMHQREITEDILSRLDTRGCHVVRVSLVCSPEALRERLGRDVAAGLRQEDVIGRSLERLACYERLDGLKLDVSDITPEEAAERIIHLTKKG